VATARKNDAKPAVTKTRGKKKLECAAAAIKKHRKLKRSEPIHVFVGNVGTHKINLLHKPDLDQD
jgi:hypothetical protein